MASGRLTLPALFLAAALAAPVTADEPPPAPAGGDPATGYAEEVSVGYVLVPVSVRSDGRYLTALSAEDFVLRVDGRVVAAASFDRAGESPVHLALLQDLSGSMGIGGRLELSRRLLSCLLDEARPGDRWALAGFASRGLTVEVPFTSDQPAVREAIDGFRAYGLTALHDAVARLPDLTAGRSRPNTAAILLTDGVENASRLSPAEARQVVRRSELPLYVVDLSRPPAGERVRVSAPTAVSTYAVLLERLASASGGRYLPVDDIAGADAACVEISTELRSRYVVGFPTADHGEKRFREIRVGVTGNGREIRHRRGYVGPPPLIPVP